MNQFISLLSAARSLCKMDTNPTKTYTHTHGRTYTHNVIISKDCTFNPLSLPPLERVRGTSNRVLLWPCWVLWRTSRNLQVLLWQCSQWWIWDHELHCSSCSWSATRSAQTWGWVQDQLAIHLCLGMYVCICLRSFVFHMCSTMYTCFHRCTALILWH